MNCSEARKLLDANMNPGPGEPTRARLGFHLSSCAACRTYRQRADPLLSALLADIPAPTLRPTLPAAPRRPRRLVWAGLALAMLALLAWAIGPTLLALATIRNDLAAISEAGAVSRATPMAYRQPSEPIPRPTLVSSPAPATAQELQPTPAFATAKPSLPSPTAGLALASLPRRADLDAPIAPDPSDQPVPALLAATAPATMLLLPTIVAPERFLPVTIAAPPGSSIGQPVADPSRRLNPEALTILLLGTDRRPGEAGPARTDAIAIAYIDRSRGRVGLLSLPRDLVVAIPEIGYARINAAAVYGELNPQLGGGRELARRTVENLLGLPIDYVAEADFMGFIAAVDALGGVTVDVAQPLYDPAYPTMDYGYQEVAFAAGPQQMDGATALIYGRIRHVDSDFERMARQQSIMLALLEQVRGQALLDQIQSVAALTTALRGFVRTDMPEERMISLAWAMRDLDPAAITRLTLARNQVASNVVPEDPYALFALPGALEGLVDQLVGP